MKKTLAIIIISLVVIITGYLAYRYFFYTCCALPPKVAPSGLIGSGEVSAFDDPDLLYGKRVLAGICRTKYGSGGSCHFNTYLYKSGKLLLESGELAMEPYGEKRTIFPTEEKTLDTLAVDEIIERIRSSGVMDKSCETDEMINDYYVDYVFNLDGIKKEIQFPGCERELDEIDKLINVAADKQL